MHRAVVGLPTHHECASAIGEVVIHRRRMPGSLILKVDLVISGAGHCILTPIGSILPIACATIVIIIPAASIAVEIKVVHVIARDIPAIYLHKLPIAVKILVVERVIPIVWR